MAVVLIVEDEPTVLLLVNGIVEAVGHRTLTAGNGGQALALLENESAIDLLITDINLGAGPNGLEVAQQAREKLPDIRVIYVSGELLTDGMRALMVDDSEFVNKPYTPEQVEDMLAAAFPPNAGNTR